VLVWKKIAGSRRQLFFNRRSPGSHCLLVCSCVLVRITLIWTLILSFFLGFRYSFPFVCLFVGIKPEKLYPASCWEGSKPPGSDHTRAEAQTTCVPKTAPQTRSQSFLFVWHLGSLTAANWVSFDFNVSYSSGWGYSLINTYKLKKKCLCVCSSAKNGEIAHQSPTNSSMCSKYVSQKRN